MTTDKLTVLDLFAGAGGLSLGFEQTKKFEVKAAVEINEFAKQTYKKNKSGVKIYPDITDIDYDQVKREFGKIDVVIGGPPCQGFSNANRQRNHLISGNNSLVKHFINAIDKLEPDAFVMENVKTMSSESHKFFMSNGEKEDLVRLKIRLNEDEEILLGDVNELAFNSDEFDAIEQDVSRFLIDKVIFSKLNFLYRVRMNSKKMNGYLLKENKLLRSLSLNTNQHHGEPVSVQYDEVWTRMVNSLNRCLDQQQVDELLLQDISLILEVQKVLSKVAEVQQHNLVHQLFIREEGFYVRLTSYNVFEFVMQKFKDLGYFPQYQVLKAAEFGVPQQRERLFVVGVKENCIANKNIRFLPKGFLCTNEYFTVSDAFEDIESIEPYTEVTEEGILKGEACKKINEFNRLYDYLNSNTKLIYNHIVTDTRETAQKRYAALKPGESFKDLTDEFKTTYSDPKRTQKTIYHRLHYGMPSRTVVNVRKSMWVHPRKNRAVSVREAARLQSFPDSYRFCGTKDAQYQQVGNAVPPLLGRAVAEQLLQVLGHTVDEPVSELLSKPLFCNV